ncbi:MAG: DUF1993 domain-containing protein [Alphaproteobacteria bacterium]|nr:DUF1993 domain-containing protein [Alphaproteobacteria bacterium]MBV9420099.1 DUF1993 domain-containing protein [Alphaproteobacteria bacterium]
MTISMYQVSVPVFLRNLNALAGVLDKAAAWAEARKFDQAVLLGTRLYPDMFTLNVQVGQVCTHAARGVAMLSGLAQPEFGAPETTIAALKERVTKTIDFVKSAKEAQIDGTEDKDVVLKFGTREMPFKGQAFLVGFTLPNFFFHYTTAYNILRSLGLEVGKRDFMGAP